MGHPEILRSSVKADGHKSKNVLLSGVGALKKYGGIYSL